MEDNGIGAANKTILHVLQQRSPFTAAIHRLPYSSRCAEQYLVGIVVGYRYTAPEVIRYGHVVLEIAPVHATIIAPDRAVNVTVPVHTATAMHCKAAEPATVVKADRDERRRSAGSGRRIFLRPRAV